jgi:hypothetical protein
VKRLNWGLVAAALVALVLPFAGGALAVAAPAAPTPVSTDSAVVASIAPPPGTTSGSESTVTVKPAITIPVRKTGGFDRKYKTPTPPITGCGYSVSGTPGSAPSKVSPKGVQGTTTADIAAFAVAFNKVRLAHCLKPISMEHITYDSCMEQRLFWMAEDPSTDPSSAWGHIGSQRSDGVPSVGCDGNLAGGLNNTGATVAQKWWDSSSHRTALYKPTYTGSTAGVCIHFAMTHGGVPNEPYAFVRAAARWVTC